MSKNTFTWRSGDPPLTCQHYLINNETCKCVECDELMIAQRINPHTVLSAPNAAGCSNPACQDALKVGTYDECNPPAGCTNPSGTYIPDRSRERTLIVGYVYEYDCGRCSSNQGSATFVSGEVTIFPCGGVHRGSYETCPADNR
jgi:hypothetical protein